MMYSLYAIVWYIYSGEITFSGSGGSQDIPSASAKSVYRFADEVCIPTNVIPISISKPVAAQNGSPQVAGIPSNCTLH